MLTCAGLEPVGNTAGNPARFIVETFSAGRGDLTVTVLNPRGVQEPVSETIIASGYSNGAMRFKRGISRATIRHDVTIRSDLVIEFLPFDH